MLLTIKKLALALSIAALTGCASQQAMKSSNTSASQSNEASFIYPVAIPIQVSYQDEIKLLRINQMIADKDNVGDKQRAVLLYQRGLLYDRMGLTAHSRYDFSESINLDPTFAEPYNSLGVYLLLTGEYDEAFELFDFAIELSNNEMQYSYLHRAVGLSLLKRHEIARDDIELFYEFDKTDPYRSLWRYLITYKMDPELALKQLQEARPEAGDKRIAWPIIYVITGKMSEEQFFEEVGKNAQNDLQLAHQLCEAYYYLAHWHIQNGDLDKGEYYLKLSIAANVRDFIEYKYALVDLKFLKQQL